MSQVYVIVMRGQRLAARCWQGNLNRGVRGKKDVWKDAKQDSLVSRFVILQWHWLLPRGSHQHVEISVLGYSRKIIFHVTPVLLDCNISKALASFVVSIPRDHSVLNSGDKIGTEHYLGFVSHPTKTYILTFIWSLCLVSESKEKQSETKLFFCISQGQGTNLWPPWFFSSTFGFANYLKDYFSSPS